MNLDHLSLNDRSFCLISQLGGWGDCPKASSRYNELSSKKVPRERDPRESTPKVKPTLKATLVTSGNKTVKPGVKHVSLGNKSVNLGVKPVNLGVKPVTPGNKPVTRGVKPVTPGKKKKKKKTRRDYSISFSDVNTENEKEDYELPDSDFITKKSVKDRTDEYVQRRREGVHQLSLEELADKYNVTMYPNLNAMKSHLGNDYKKILGLSKYATLMKCNTINLLHSVIATHLLASLANSSTISNEHIDRISQKISAVIYSDTLHNQKAIEAKWRISSIIFNRMIGKESVISQIRKHL